MNNKHRSLQELKTISNKHREENQTIGLIVGCFDILHIGHVNLFREAKKHIDILIIELENDENIKTLKGENRPIHTFEHRAEVLSELQSIDYIFKVEKSFTTDSKEAAAYYENLIKEINPHYLITSTKRDKYNKHKKQSALANNIQILEIEPMSLTSTTEILSKLLSIG
ncbi:MAG: adenylyltransferase/cytidyltransferase family protein [bacterium]|nr:adenylyltransferase/cytidyltransferase family protein [bacterium]